MGDLITSVGAEFFKAGLLGALLIVAGIVIFLLARRYDAVQEKRIAEARESLTVMSTITAAFDSLADLIKDRRHGL